MAQNFHWDETEVNGRVHDASADIRIVRPLLKLYGKQDGPASTVSGHKVVRDGNGALTIDKIQNLETITLSCDIVVPLEQFNDEDSLHILAVEAAYRIAAAEDAVLLLGAGADITRLGVNAGNGQLAAQPGLLPDKATVKRPILESIVHGIADLQKKNRYGRYAAVVSLDLFQEAMQPRQNPLDAPIYEIRPLLIDGGFCHSQSLPLKTGVIFSVNGDGLKIAVPWDTHVDQVKEETDAHLRVVEQIRLVVDVPEAVVSLK